MNKEILLNYLNCILINSGDTFEVELNGERIELTSDAIFYKIHFNAIEYIVVNDEDSSYIKFLDGQELVIFHQDYLDNVDKEILVEYIKFLEKHGEEFNKKYRNIGIA